MSEWTARNEHGDCWIVDGPTQDDGLTGGYRWMSKADAELAAAAPDLLAACCAALEQAWGCAREHYGENPEGLGCTPRHIALMIAAIAKAGGKPTPPSSSFYIDDETGRMHLRG